MGKAAKKEDFSRANAELLQDKCVVLSVEFMKFGTSRKADLDKVETEADKSRLHVSKSIMVSENLKAINNIWRKGRDWLWTKVVPSPLREGMYLCPIELVDEVDMGLQGFEEQAKPFIKQLVAELPEIKRRDKASLKNQYRESDYPTAEELKESFYIDTMYVDFRVPDKLAAVSPKLFRRETEKDTDRWEDASEDIKYFLRWAMVNCVERVVNVLSAKNPRIYPSLVADTQQFIRDFDARNVTDDRALKTAVARARKIVEAIDVESLREDRDLQKQVKQQFERIADEVEELVKDDPMGYEPKPEKKSGGRVIRKIELPD